MAGMLATTLMLFGLMSIVHPLSFAVAAEAPTGTSTVPPPVPLAVANPNNPYYNNPYYNNPYYNNQYYNTNRAGPAVPILSYASEHVGDGSYAFSFTTGDGKQAQESGFLKDAYIDNTGNPQGTQVVQGSYAYVSPEGTPIQVSYVADENGFRPSGVHIPADGKTPLAQVPLVDGKDRTFDPLYNRYNYRNPYSPYNRPYDTRYPYDSTKYRPYNERYNPYLGPVQIKENKKETTQQ
ncbi:hypothetical protein O3G_MSEX007357 [Manduca sexta]|uniref:Cuticle protein n=1 Tax=Manduca sexta TaxID=7130 RepID=A0A921Z5J9_MANSE|nr:hypothetical protein O3G_MSEX007357 [Manduca sexta]KAG6451783.1 hypothetical protein O3G_MSEX007357 [Manduca sexta]